MCEASPVLGRGVVGLSLVPAITASVVLLPRSVAADQVSDLKTQAAQIAKDLVLEQLQIGTYQQLYDVDVARVRQDQAEIASSQARIQADVSRVSHDHERLVSEAVSAYINLDPEVSGASEALFENQAQTPTKAEYEEVASGDISLAIDTLHTDENGLRVATDHARSARSARSSHDQPGSGRQQLRAAGGERARGQAGRGHRPTRRRRGTAAGGAGRGRGGRGPGGSGRGEQERNDHDTPCGLLQLSGAGSERRHHRRQSVPTSLLAMCPPGRVGRGLPSRLPGGTYMGGFQFSQATWNEAAQLAGMPQLINVPPNDASPADQDDLAIALYNADGEQPWNDSCRNS